jgi:hypothetical protein
MWHSMRFVLAAASNVLWMDTQHQETLSHDRNERQRQAHPPIARRGDLGSAIRLIATPNEAN